MERKFQIGDIVQLVEPFKNHDGEILSKGTLVKVIEYSNLPGLFATRINGEMYYINFDKAVLYSKRKISHHKTYLILTKILVCLFSGWLLNTVYNILELDVQISAFHSIGIILLIVNIVISIVVYLLLVEKYFQNKREKLIKKRTE